MTESTAGSRIVAALAVALLASVFLSGWAFWRNEQAHNRRAVERCEDYNRGLAASRDAWMFMEQILRIQWAATPPGNDQRTQIVGFLTGIQKRLEPIDC